MKTNIQGINVNYLDEGKGNNIVILHGWGASIKVMNGMFEHLSKNNRVVVLDLPGFGDSDEPSYGWNLDNYVDFTLEFIKKLKITNPIIIGHSFGGRIAIKIASFDKIKLNKVILIDSAGIKRQKKQSLKTKVIKTLGKFAKIFSPNLVQKLKNKVGSIDYKSSSPIMKEVLVNVIEEDLTDYLPNIKYSTLLIWGENDNDTPFADALIMNDKIEDSGIVKVSNAGHFSFIDNPILVYSVIDSFIGSDK